MNKRQVKKTKRKVPKEVLRLVTKYTKVHRYIDMLGEGFGVYIQNEFDTESGGIPDYKFVRIMTDKTYKKYYDDCCRLFVLTERIMNPDSDIEPYDFGEYDKHYNYRITKKPVGEYDPKLDYWVRQKTILEDSYEGTVSIKIKEGKYLVFDYEC